MYHRRSVSREFKLYELEMDHNSAAQANKNICSAKGEGAFDSSAVTRWFEEF